MPRKISAKKSQFPKGIKQPPKKNPPVKRTPFTHPDSRIAIDHPVNGEIVAGHHYSVRISSDAPGKVEISIDGGDWQPCRTAVGFWWYDWHHIPSGPHKIVARAIDENGFIANKSKVVKFECR